ncbi:hypothetical protein KO481_36240 [Nocardia sp. NEAU-G5]|uniref:Uncharacterized protein n=1 Tax=Nocardia albiluteola TaxID=2842303 RepID=A0ABS6BB09_9NOCA|nr:hypothetical protein [Nocardia albiluteola]MBU3066960.1 hypothetical protein [Nocardia albiluteola]
MTGRQTLGVQNIEARDGHLDLRRLTGSQDESTAEQRSGHDSAEATLNLDQHPDIFYPTGDTGCRYPRCELPRRLM